VRQAVHVTMILVASIVFIVIALLMIIWLYPSFIWRESVIKKAAAYFAPGTKIQWESL